MAAFVRLCGIGFLAYCSYAICRTPLLPLFARDLGATPHGVFGSIYDIGDASGPIAAGVLVATLGYARMFQVMALIAFSMAAVFAIVAARSSPQAVSEQT